MIFVIHFSLSNPDRSEKKYQDTIFAKNHGAGAVIEHNLKGAACPPFPNSMLGRQKCNVWLRDANIETGGGREGEKNVSRNGILHANACEN
jgi:hypothetical protein